jgi:hypothetical protein
MSEAMVLQWKLREATALLTELRAGPVFAVADLRPGEATICLRHRIGLEADVTATLCANDHLTDPQTECSTCGRKSGELEFRSATLEIPEDDPLVVQHERDEPTWTWWGRLTVEPFAFICPDCVRLWDGQPAA